MRTTTLFGILVTAISGAIAYGTHDASIAVAAVLAAVITVIDYMVSNKPDPAPVQEIQFVAATPVAPAPPVETPVAPPAPSVVEVAKVEAPVKSKPAAAKPAIKAAPKQRPKAPAKPKAAPVKAPAKRSAPSAPKMTASAKSKTKRTK